MMLLLSAAGRVGMENLEIGDNVSCGGRNGYVINVVMLLCLKNCATLLGIRSCI